MHEFKIIHEDVKGFIDKTNKLSYFRIIGEDNIWVCHETGELLYLDNMKNLNESLLIDNDIIGKYIISQEEGMIICLGKVTNIYSETGDDEYVELVGEFFTFSYAYNFINDSYTFSSELSKTEDENWFLGKEYTWELIVISKERYLDILKQIDNGGNEKIFSMIDQLIYSEKYYVENE